MNGKTTVWRVLSLATAPLLGCSGAYDLERTDEVSESIIRGTELSMAASQASGIVFFEQGCTGTALNEYWVLTAAHCFAAADDANNDGQIDNPAPADHRYRMHLGNNQPDGSNNPNFVDPARIVRHPLAYWGDPARVDAALVQTSTAIPLNATPVNHLTNGRMAIYGETSGSLMDATLTCYGYGKNEGGYGAPYPGVGTLRYSRLKVSRTWAEGGWHSLRLQSPSGDGTGIICNGDSGGPCFLDVPTSTGLKARFLAGVHSTSSCDIGQTSYTDDIGARGFIDWVNGIVYPTETARINCSGTTCSSQPNPLPNNVNTSGTYAPFGANERMCYYYQATYDLEPNYDFLKVNGEQKTASGTVSGHICGVTPLALTTDYSVASRGLVSVVASNQTCSYNCGPLPTGQSCAGTPGQWAGCRGTGCSVCADLVRDYPRYFVRHPSCGPNTTCDGIQATCNSNCPAPTVADK